MFNLQNKLEEFMENMSYDNENNIIGVYFKNKNDLDYSISFLEDFFVKNKFSVVNTYMNYFSICDKCKINFIVIRDYIIKYKFSHVIYDKRISNYFVENIILPSFVGSTERNCVKINLL